ncbi:DUF6881 domain-containing protein [Klebsiella aerogenes]|uniref:DUF6881 domain-containing protein n=1 Tax=Klebsiella aerogenes TaxID=548 RepID=UPI00227995DC|nr:hypothetical protein [Klebsiella aerogenes]MCY4764679.1 hypothetical protein [Klebsiella aerogenes]
MQYIKVFWCHFFDTEPIKYYSEIDENRFEVRKIAVFRNGERYHCGNHIPESTIMLGVVPIPSLAEINKVPQFHATYITAAEFEDVWQKTV